LQVKVHAPLVQAGVAFAGGWQVMQVGPHWLTLSVTQAPPQERNPDMQLQVCAATLQVWLAPHAAVDAQPGVHWWVERSQYVSPVQAASAMQPGLHWWVERSQYVSPVHGAVVQSAPTPPPAPPVPAPPVPVAPPWPANEPPVPPVECPPIPAASAPPVPLPEVPAPLPMPPLPGPPAVPLDPP
jgi:hypothetical protein